MSGILTQMIALGGRAFVPTAAPALLTHSFSGVTQSTNPQPCNVTIVGGAGPFQYLWIQVSGYSGITALTPSDQTTFFRSASALPPPDPSSSQTSTWHCRVTDTATGFVEFSNTVTVGFTRTS